MLKTYKGSCHCGKIRYEADIDLAAGTGRCNCSICTMTGFLHVMVPHADVELLTGRDTLASYRFGTGTAEHLFCSNCGVKSFYQPRSHPDCWSLNANCSAQPVELAVELFDGKNWEQAKASLDASG